MQPSINEIKNQIWTLQTPPKIKLFMWNAVSGAIPVADRIASRGIKVDSRCQVCGLEGEYSNHVLFSCDVARYVYVLYPISLAQKWF